jgi:hypothetical protein
MDHQVEDLDHFGLEVEAFLGTHGGNFTHRAGGHGKGTGRFPFGPIRIGGDRLLA